MFELTKDFLQIVRRICLVISTREVQKLSCIQFCGNIVSSRPHPGPMVLGEFMEKMW